MAIALAVLLLIALGFNAGQIETKLVEAPMLNRQTGLTSVTGRLVFTEVMPDGVRLTLKDPEIDRLPPGKTPLKVRVRLARKNLADVPPAGSLINLWAELGPFSEPVMPHAMDFRWQAFYRQLGGLGWSTGDIRLVDPNPPVTSWRDWFTITFERARVTLTQHVYAHLSGDVAAMTAARLNGEQTGISEPVIQAMRVAGLAHLLSTSGFHVTIMGLLVYFPLRAILALIPWVALRFPIKKWAATGAILSTVGYTLLVGSPAATLRSMIMTGIAMTAVIVDRPAAIMRLVMLSAAIVMLMAPDAMLGPSFQMSFAAVLCLIAAYERAPGWTAPEPARFALPGWLDWSYGALSFHHRAHIADRDRRDHAVFDLSFRHFQFLRLCRECPRDSDHQLLGDAVHRAGLHHRADGMGRPVYHRRGVGHRRHHPYCANGGRVALCAAACAGDAGGGAYRRDAWRLVALPVAAALAVFGIAAGCARHDLSALYGATGFYGDG